MQYIDADSFQLAGGRYTVAVKTEHAGFDVA